MKDVYYKYDFRGANDAQELHTRFKEDDPVAIQIIASDMAPILGHPCYLVPIPNEFGHTFLSFRLSNLLSKFYPGVDVFDIIRGSGKNSFFDGKAKWARMGEPCFNFLLTAPVPKGKRIILVDNVIGTGLTAAAALRLIPSADVLVHSVDRQTFERSIYRRQFSSVYLCDGNRKTLFDTPVRAVKSSPKNTPAEKKKTPPVQKTKTTPNKRKPK